MELEKTNPIPERLSKIDHKLLTDTWPAVCPHCGGALVWNDDQMLSDIGYLPEDAGEDENRIVHIMSCSECQRLFEFVDLDDGWNALLSMSNSRGGMSYTKLARAYFNDEIVKV